MRMTKPPQSRRHKALIELEFAPTDDPTPEELKRRFKTLALTYHPDHNNGDDTKFKAIKHAFDILNDLGERGEIDPDIVAEILFGIRPRRSKIQKKGRYE
jgi:curved DNA-binding protein CbpA